MLDRYNFKIPTFLDGQTHYDLGTPILAKITTEIYRPKFLTIPVGNWRERMEQINVLHVYEPANRIVIDLLDNTDYLSVVGRAIKTPIRIWHAAYRLDAGYQSESALRLEVHLKRHFNIFIPIPSCEEIISYLKRQPMSARLRFEEIEVKTGKVFFVEKLGRAIRTGRS